MPKKTKLQKPLTRSNTMCYVNTSYTGPIITTINRKNNWYECTIRKNAGTGSTQINYLCNYPAKFLLKISKLHKLSLKNTFIISFADLRYVLNNE